MKWMKIGLIPMYSVAVVQMQICILGESPSLSVDKFITRRIIFTSF